MKSLGLSILFLALFMVAAPATAGAVDIYHLVNVQADTETELRDIAALGLDITKVNREGLVEVVATDADIKDLREIGFTVDVKITDMASFYAESLRVPEGHRGFPDGSMGGYYTFSEIVAFMDEWATNYPNLITQKQSIGQSIEGRDIWAIKVSDNPNIDEDEPEVYFDALTHAREPQSMMTLVYFIMQLLEGYGIDPEMSYLVDSREIWFVLCANPDGYLYNEQTYPSGGGMWRKNRRNNGGGEYGVDLNRNYGYKWGYNNTGSSPYPSSDLYRGTGPFSEPETAAVRDFVLSRNFVASWNTHTYSGYYLCPFGYDYLYPPGTDWDIYQEILADISADNGYETGPISYVLYDANGGATDWHYAETGAFNITPEIGQIGFWPPFSSIMTEVLENQPAIEYFTWIGGSYVLLNGHTLADDNGDGYFHPGEPVNVTLTLRNKGLADTLTDVIAHVTSSSPYVTLTNDTFNFGTLASRTDANNSGDPLIATLKPTTPYGETIVLDVSIQFDGHTLELPISLTAGIPNVAFDDTFENNLGWTTQNTSVDTGEWERANPAGTDAQPENDHTAIGTMCYVTGPAGGSSGNDDLDGGPTRLISPTFDLSAGDADVSFYYWFYHSSYGAQHPLDIHISNNGGGSWTLVDQLTHKPSWNNYSFKVSDHITPTANMKIRFSANDNPNDDIVEALIDDVQIMAFQPALSLSYTGTPELGGSVNFILDAGGDANLGYFMAASLTAYPVIPVGHRFFPLGYDFMLLPFSITPGNGIFNNFVGTLDGSGHTEDPEFLIPNKPILLGKTIFFAAATLDAAYPEGVKNFSAPVYVEIQ